jgi:hypothetical protein
LRASVDFPQPRLAVEQRAAHFLRERGVTGKRQAAEQPYRKRPQGGQERALDIEATNLTDHPVLIVKARIMAEAKR